MDLLNVATGNRLQGSKVAGAPMAFDFKEAPKRQEPTGETPEMMQRDQSSCREIQIIITSKTIIIKRSTK